MDTLFYLTIVTGLLAAVVSSITYYKGVQKEINAEKQNKELLNISSENTKQIIGDGVPTLSAGFFPDKLIYLSIINTSNYPIYDISLVFGDPDTTKLLKKVVLDKNGVAIWDDLRSQILSINPFNLPPNSSKIFYNFTLPEHLQQTGVFLNVTARHNSFSGQIYIERKAESFIFWSKVTDSHGKILTEWKSSQ